MMMIAASSSLGPTPAPTKHAFRSLTGAGLGGGSGNAATTLWAANEMTGRPASNEDLLQWSGEIGSDISVFFRCGGEICLSPCVSMSVPARADTRCHPKCLLCCACYSNGTVFCLSDIQIHICQQQWGGVLHRERGDRRGCEAADTARDAHAAGGNTLTPQR